jgi:hypothetical protein
MITRERLKELLSYDSTDGTFRWLLPTTNRVNVGDIAGWNSGPYRSIKLDGGSYKAHRLAWLYVHGRWPRVHIDHIDGNGFNNAIANLREATRSENMSNTGCRKHNTSGVKGVFWDAGVNKWRASINANGRRHYLGIYEDKAVAAEAYANAARRLHGEFARLDNGLAD